MSPKIIGALINCIISFVILSVLSFFMDKLVNHSELGFIDFLKARWMYFLAIVLIYTIYTNFIKGKNIQK